VGDVGTHAENLLEYITGLKITELAADATRFVEGRALDDDINVLVRLEGGAKGVLHASQISVGEENNLNIRVYGEKGGLEWHQREPNTLQVKHLDRPIELFRTGQGYLGAAAKRATRTPAGHPEGYLEAFSNIYRNFGEHVLAVADKSQPDPLALDYPGIDDAVRGMAFIEAVVRSSAANTAWTKLDA
jgi:predicted dehydrogenase